MDMLQNILLAAVVVGFYFIGKARGWNAAMKAMESINTRATHVLWGGKPTSPDASTQRRG